MRHALLRLLASRWFLFISSLRFDTIRFGVTFLLCGYCYSQTLGKVVLNIIGKMKTLTKAKASIHGQQIFIVCTQHRRQFTIFSFSFWCVCFLFWLHALIILSKWMYGIEQVLGEAHTNSHPSLNTWNSSSQPTFTFAKEVFVFLVFLLGISIASGIYRVTDKSTFDLWVKLILWTWHILWIKITWRIKSTLSWIKLTLLEI